MAAKPRQAKLTLGPVLFNWAPGRWRDFYLRIADEAPVESVCVGEVVCSKRAPFFEPVLGAVIERLEAAGKEVVRSTLALIMNEREMDTVRALAAGKDLFVEANDIAAVSLLSGRRHAIGPYVNVYNEDTLAFLARHGATRVSLPGELPARSIAALAGAGGPELEVQVFGRLPLAISGRCFHARSRGLNKDGCRYVCAEDPDGMEVETLDGDPFLAVNGTQTLSYTWCNLAGELAELRAMGVHRFRLSPQDTDMVAVARIFRDLLDGRRQPGEARESLAGLAGGIPFSNGFYYGVEGVAFRGPESGASPPASV
ncbi:MAG: U32 family peptidase [Proteobacteria bacterium]|nr:U32 family peptidase [Pseudomonadota bacterium]